MQLFNKIKKILSFILLTALVGLSYPIFATSNLFNPKRLFSKTETVAPTSSATASLEFSKEGKRLYVYLVIQQTKDISGTVKVVWKSPETSICGDSEYSLKYSGLQYKTRAYRTVTLDTQDGDPLTCTGDWKVSIVDLLGKEIASGSVHVQDDGVLDQALANDSTTLDDEDEE